VKEKNRPSWVGDILLFLTAFLWGGGFVGVAEALDALPPFYLIAIRFMMASILIVVIFWKYFIQINKKEIIPGIICGLILFIAYAFQTVGAQYTTVGKLAFLTALNVIIVPFITWMALHEKIHKYNIVSSVIAVIGFGFLNLTGESGVNFGRGEMYGTLCAIGFAMHISILGYYTSKYDPIKLSIMQMITCAVLSLCFALAFEEAPTNLDTSMMIPVGYLGVCSTFMAIGATLIFGAVIIAEYMHAKLS